MSIFDNILQNIPSSIIYWFSFLISIFLSWIYQKLRIKSKPANSFIIRPMTRTTQVFFLIMIIIVPAVIIGYRDFSVGTDTSNYVNQYYNAINLLHSESANTNILFALLRSLIFIISNGNNPSFFLFLMAFSTLYIFISGLNKWLGKISIPMGLFIYYSIFGLQLLNQSRQMLAVSIVFYAIPYVLSEEKIKYIVSILIASLIHFSALIGLLFMFFYFKNNKFYTIKNRIFQLLIILSPILIIPILNLTVIFLPEKYSMYILMADVESAGLGWIITIFPIIIPIIFFRRYINDHKIRFLTNVTILTFTFRIMGYYSYFLYRLTHYSMIYLVVLIPLILTKSKRTKYHNIIYLVLIVIMLIYYIIQYMGINPAEFFPYYFVNN